MFQIWLLSALMRSPQILFLLFLPILYHEQLINEIQIGYLWWLLLIWSVLWSYIAVTYLQRHSSKKLLLLAISLCIIASGLIYIHSSIVLTIAYSIVWLAVGIGMSSVTNIQYTFSSNSDRFSKLANISMFGDVLRISFPIVIGLIYKSFWLYYIQLFSLLLWIVLLLFIYYSRSLESHSYVEGKEATHFSFRYFWKNKEFVFVSTMEFLDWLSSSQLFIFLPLLLASKGIIFENAVLLQSTIFLGYLCGRRIIARLASVYNGYSSVALAEIGMAWSIIWILALNSTILIIMLCFLLGICARGTSPVIKWLAFNTLKLEESSSWSGIYVFIGNIADVVAQFTFGILFAGIGIYGPFWLSWGIAIILAVMCLIKALRRNKS